MKIIVEIEVNEIHEDGDIYYDGGDITVKNEGVPGKALYGLAESFGQSDWAFVDFPNAVVDGIAALSKEES